MTASFIKHGETYQIQHMNIIQGTEVQLQAGSLSPVDVKSYQKKMKLL